MCTTRVCDHGGAWSGCRQAVKRSPANSWLVGFKSCNVAERHFAGQIDGRTSCDITVYPSYIPGYSAASGVAQTELPCRFTRRHPQSPGSSSIHGAMGFVVRLTLTTTHVLDHEIRGRYASEWSVVLKTYTQQPKSTQQTMSAESMIPSWEKLGQSCEVNSTPHLQRVIGDSGVKRLPESNIGNQVAQRWLLPDATGTEEHAPTTSSTRIDHDFGRISVLGPSPVRIQPNLVVNTPGDVFENEADQIAEQVMRMSAPGYVRACPRGGEFPQCPDKQGHHETIQTKATHASGARISSVPSGVHNILRTPGQPMDAATRSFFEPRFGHDFSQVRIHTDASADASARALSARAYTAGSHIVFGSGQFSPTTLAGKRLLAHELTHVIQQQSQPLARRMIQRQDALICEKEKQPGVTVEYRGGRCRYRRVGGTDTEIWRLAFAAGFKPDFGIVERTFRKTPCFDRKRSFAQHIGSKFYFEVDSGQIVAFGGVNATDPSKTRCTVPGTAKKESKKPDTRDEKPTAGDQENKLVDEIIDLVSPGPKTPGNMQLAYRTLSSLSKAKLVGTLRILDNKHSFAFLILKDNIKKYAHLKGINVTKLVIAFDAVNKAEASRHIDHFAVAGIDPSSFGKPDPERLKQGKWNIKLTLSFQAAPDMTIYADDVADDRPKGKALKEQAQTHAGKNGILIPKNMNRGTTPNLWQAKQSAIAEIESANERFKGVARGAMETLMGAYVVGWMYVNPTIGALSARTGQYRGMVPRSVSKGSKPKGGRASPIDPSWRAHEEAGYDFLARSFDMVTAKNARVRIAAYNKAPRKIPGFPHSGKSKIKSTEWIPDYLARNTDGPINVFDMKMSKAGPTGPQRVGGELLEKYGGVVVSSRDPSFPVGMEIPPQRITVLRPKDIGR